MFSHCSAIPNQAIPLLVAADPPGPSLLTSQVGDQGTHTNRPGCESVGWCISIVDTCLNYITNQQV